MTRYAAGIAEVLEPVVAEVETVSATNINLPPPFRWAFTRYRGVERLPRHWSTPVDLVHFTDVFLAPHAPRFSCARVSTVHDMIPMEHARIRRWVSLRWRMAFLRSIRSLDKSDALIVPSANTRKELLEHVDFDSDRIHVVPVLVPDAICPPSPGAVREPRTILSVGTTALYKNIGVLIHALANKDLGDVRLVRVGSPFEAEYRELAQRLGVWDRIEQNVDVPEERLIQLYQSATVLAQPSLTEGFGMPVAEAMAAGLPVVVSDGGSLPEVVETAGRVVPFRNHHAGEPDLDDARDFGVALAEVLADAAERQRMSVAGIAEAQRFRVPAVRTSLLAAYDQAMSTFELRTEAAH
ncbi:MAG: glycosyltransferase family 1 protein [bacterium]